MLTIIAFILASLLISTVGVVCGLVFYLHNVRVRERSHNDYIKRARSTRSRFTPEETRATIRQWCEQNPHIANQWLRK